MSASEIRINARLTGEDARRFEELRASEKQSASYVIREAVREYHAKRIKPRKSAYRIMMESGFIGAIQDGALDASSEESIRTAMDDLLKHKYPHAFESAEPPARQKAKRKAK